MRREFANANIRAPGVSWALRRILPQTSCFGYKLKETNVPRICYCFRPHVHGTKFGSHTTIYNRS